MDAGSGKLDNGRPPRLCTCTGLHKVSTRRVGLQQNSKIIEHDPAEASRKTVTLKDAMRRCGKRSLAGLPHRHGPDPTVARSRQDAVGHATQTRETRNSATLRHEGKIKEDRRGCPVLAPRLPSYTPAHQLFIMS